MSRYVTKFFLETKLCRSERSPTFYLVDVSCVVLLCFTLEPIIITLRFFQ